MQRWVLHIDMDAFFASCEQLTRPTLRGRPVVVGGLGGRSVVAGASYEARALGAHSAMPMYQAKTLIGFRGVVVQPRFAVYQAASRRVFSILQEFSPVVEKISVDEGFLEPPELVGAGAKEVTDFANRLRGRILDETGLPSSVGAGSGRQFAKIGSGLAKPDGTFVIPADKHEQLLHPLGVNKLWGVGPVTHAKLKQLGVETIGDLARLSEKELSISFGSAIGRSLWLIAQGIDTKPVAPRAIAKQISAEHTYPEDLRTVAEVDQAIRRAAEGAMKRLLHDGRGARTVTLKLRMADMHAETRSMTLPYATNDAETLCATALSLARYPDEVGPIRLVGVSYSGLDDARQDVLFPELDHQIRRPVADTDYESGVRSSIVEEPQPHEEASVEDSSAFWQTQDVSHPEFGHGWIQGLGHGKVTVRFETRTTRPQDSLVRTFAADDPKINPADPLASLDWGTSALVDAVKDRREEEDAGEVP
ncbi:DNA polymerase IV [Corynebacterium sp. SCR221107]|uniref:DNA polymerase IV n=1 Tax=Corynebacterium sp. SCR221107 TaxID=3017361 RepID=UPI0022EC6345|nr:DNA polymerase IV [Corynebacterium sp. SCR221107]WBT07997.1 DNA polymerase IV [Corynebacterium sp. SCR221107]